MREFFEVMAAIVAAVLAVVAVVMFSVFGFQTFVEKPACEAYGVMSKQNTYYSLGTSCLVERNGEWVNYEVAVGKKQEITVKSK